MPERPITFQVDGLTLHGNLATSREKSPCIILCHGLEGHKDSEKWRMLSQRLIDAGFATLRFNFRGCGENEARSDGNFEESTISARVRDLKAAMDFLKSSYVDYDRIGAVGSSLGGAVVISAEDPRLQILILLATPASMKANNSDSSREVVELASGRRLDGRFFEDASKYDMPIILARQSRPTLIIHGSNDDVVPVKHALQLHECASEPKNLCIVSGADHSFHQPTHLNQAITSILDWVRRHL
jgi:dipeptidyl aminopeptidase/acylaminoacyl peptidase